MKMETVKYLFDDKIMLLRYQSIIASKSNSVVFLRTEDNASYLILDSFLKNKIEYEILIYPKVVKFATTTILSDNIYLEIENFVNSNEFINHPAHIL
jgi:hypothetical protein